MPRFTLPSVPRRALKTLLRRMGYKITPIREAGEDPLADMARFVGCNPKILDVGANVGQSIRKFRAAFPGAEIHSFEPSPATFAVLEAVPEFQRDPRIHLWKLALGSVRGELELWENEQNVMSSFLLPEESGWEWGKLAGKSLVKVVAVDEFCAELGIETVDILKSDAQGYDFEVLQGASSMLGAGRIGLVYYEAIISNQYKGLPRFTEAINFLLDKDYVLASNYTVFYQQGLASWTDFLFIHKSRLSRQHSN
jgi:FkbM family methyltransferase